MSYIKKKEKKSRPKKQGQMLSSLFQFKIAALAPESPETSKQPPSCQSHPPKMNINNVNNPHVYTTYGRLVKSNEGAAKS